MATGQRRATLTWNSTYIWDMRPGQGTAPNGQNLYSWMARLAIMFGVLLPLEKRHSSAGGARLALMLDQRVSQTISNHLC